jgi:hypothetical protein
MICVPGTILADYILHNASITVCQIIGATAILIGFAMLNFDPFSMCRKKPLMILEDDNGEEFNLEVDYDNEGFSLVDPSADF